MRGRAVCAAPRGCGNGSGSRAAGGPAAGRAPVAVWSCWSCWSCCRRVGFVGLVRPAGLSPQPAGPIAQVDSSGGPDGSRRPQQLGRRRTRGAGGGSAAGAAVRRRLSTTAASVLRGRGRQGILVRHGNDGTPAGRRRGVPPNLCARRLGSSSLPACPASYACATKGFGGSHRGLRRQAARACPPGRPRRHRGRRRPTTRARWAPVRCMTATTSSASSRAPTVARSRSRRRGDRSLALRSRRVEHVLEVQVADQVAAGVGHREPGVAGLGHGPLDVGRRGPLGRATRSASGTATSPASRPAKASAPLSRPCWSSIRPSRRDSARIEATSSAVNAEVTSSFGSTPQRADQRLGHGVQARGPAGRWPGRTRRAAAPAAARPGPARRARGSSAPSRRARRAGRPRGPAPTAKATGCTQPVRDVGRVERRDEQLRRRPARPPRRARASRP